MMTMMMMGYGRRSRSIKAAAASAAAVVWAAVVLRLAGPSIVGFVVDDLPLLYGSVLEWLTPPYLYLVINAIILSIAASSRFRAAPSGSDPDPDPAAAEIAVAAVAPPREDVAAVAEVEEEDVAEREREREREKVEREEVETEKVETRGEEEEEEMVREKPLFSARLGHQNRKSAKKPASYEGKALRVARPRRDETLESTWRTITEGRAVPLARHLRKSDTWEARGGRGGNDVSPQLEPPPMRKAETFHERGGRGGGGAGSDGGGGGGGGGGKVRREPSLGQEELNRKVEAFINKFNEDMRLQRQESLLHYMQMINQGSH